MDGIGISNQVNSSQVSGGLGTIGKTPADNQAQQAAPSQSVTPAQSQAIGEKQETAGAATAAFKGDQSIPDDMKAMVEDLKKLPASQLEELKSKAGENFGRALQSQDPETKKALSGISDGLKSDAAESEKNGGKKLDMSAEFSRRVLRSCVDENGGELNKMYKESQANGNTQKSQNLANLANRSYCYTAISYATSGQQNQQ